MKYFKLSEFDCKETGENRMDLEFLDKLDDLREKCDFPFIINSGFRSKAHSREVVKPIPGMHTEGKAADIRVSNGFERGLIVEHAIRMGFNGIGVAKTFIHVDTREGDLIVWSY